MTPERQTEHPVDLLFTRGWSPRAFTGEALSSQLLHSFFEAARWAPQSSNAQPWRFHLFWKGHLIEIWLERKVEGERHGKGSTTWAFSGWIPPAELRAELREMAEALKAALTVYRDAGTYSSITENTAIFKNF